MMAMVQQLIFVLSVSASIPVSSDVFRLVGSFVQLDIQDHGTKIIDFSWKYNRTTNIVKYYADFEKVNKHPLYEGRVEFNNATYSLILKNLQKTDSGLYEAKASDEEDKPVANYTLSVLDPVEAPVLTHQLSNNTCNITLTCRGHDLSINSSCYKKTCEEKEVTSPGGVTLSLSVSDSTIICNHSNPVSWKEDVLKIKVYEEGCSYDGNKDQHGDSISNWLCSVFASLLIFMVIALHGACRLKSSTGNEAVLTSVMWLSTTTASFHWEKTQHLTQVEFKQVPRDSTMLDTPSTAGKMPEHTRVQSDHSNS